MQRLFKYFFMLWLTCYQASSYAERQKIVLATAEWEPYISETRVGHGQFAEIVTAVFKEMGMETEFIFAPWKRVEVLVKNGDAFAGIPYAYTDERHKIFDYSVPIMDSTYVFFYKKKNFPQGIRYEKLNDLARYSINGVRGYWYESPFADAKLNIEYVTTDEQGFLKLNFDRVDLVASDDKVGWALIKKLYPNQLSEFEMTKKPFATQQLHLMISRKYPNAVAITKKFNETFERMKAHKKLPL